MTEQKHDILVVNAQESLQDKLLTFYRAHSKKIKLLLGFWFVGLVGIGGFLGWEEYQERLPIDQASVTIQPDKLGSVIGEQFKGGQVLSYDLEREDGKIVYEATVKQEQGLFEVEVDAETGKILKVDQ